MAVHFFPENPTTSGGGTDPGFITLTGDISGSGSGTISAFLPAITTGKTSTKITFNSKGQVTGGTSLTDLDLPAHSHNVVILGDVTGTGTNSSISTSLTSVTTAGSGIKINYDDKGRVLSSEGLTTIDLPIHTHPVTISGDVTGTGTNSNITTSLPIITSPGQAVKVSYTAKGLVYAGTSLSDTDLPAHNHPVTMTGDVTGTGTNSSIATTLASITTGKTSTKVTFNNKGLILSGTTLSDTDLPAHTHTVTLTGDVTGTGSNSSITTALPSITSANTATKITYTAKGLVAGGTTLTDTDLPPHSHTINVSGDIAGTGLNSGLTLTLPNIATAGTYPKVSINAKGQVTSGSNLLATDIPNLDWAKITTGKPTTIGGYGITDAYTKLEIDGSLSNKQNLSNELTALSSLADTTGFIRKTGDGTYTIDTSVYLTTSSASSLYQPLNTNLTGVSGLAGLNGIARKTGGVWELDTNTYLTGNQTITLSGDVTGSGTTSINVTLPNLVTAGSSAKPTYNAKGLVIGSGSLVASDIPSLDWAKITTGKPTSLSGYGIADPLVTTDTVQTISGTKTFTGAITGSRNNIQFVLNQSGVTQPTALLSNQSGLFYFFCSDVSASVNTTINALRPLIIDLTSGLLSSANGQSFAGGISSSGALTVTNNTASTSTTTGAITSVGGVSSQGAMWASSFNGSGAGLTALNASNLASGTIPNARLTGNYTGIANLTGSANCTFGAFYVNNTSTWDIAAGRIASVANRLQIVGIPASNGATRIIEISGAIQDAINVTSGTTNKAIYFSSLINGVYANRWIMYSDPVASETGANAGSDFYIGCYDDTGAWLGWGFSIKRSTKDVTIASTTASTSTTTGALKVSGGIASQGALFAQSLNGQLNLKKLTTATRPTPSVSTEGQCWYNTDTKNVEFATNTSVKVVTAA